MSKLTTSNRAKVSDDDRTNDHPTNNLNELVSSIYATAFRNNRSYRNDSTQSLADHGARDRRQARIGAKPKSKSAAGAKHHPHRVPASGPHGSQPSAGLNQAPLHPQTASQA
jgi:hypothetical protein